MPLSTDHTAEREDERQRIVQAGGHVSHVMGSWRIGEAGIQVSRCVSLLFWSQQVLFICQAHKPFDHPCACLLTWWQAGAVLRACLIRLAGQRQDSLKTRCRWLFLNTCSGRDMQYPSCCTAPNALSGSSLLQCQRRCLGDHDLKGKGGLTAEPEVTFRDLDDRDAFIILASDGLWDCIGNAEAVNIVHDTGVSDYCLLAVFPLFSEQPCASVFLCTAGLHHLPLHVTQDSETSCLKHPSCGVPFHAILSAWLSPRALASVVMLCY